MQRVQSPREIELEDLPATVWMLVTGVALFVFGLALEWWGYGVEAGLSGTLALIAVSLAVLGHLAIWILGKID